MDPRQEVYINSLENSLAFDNWDEAVGRGAHGVMTRYVREDIRCRSCLKAGSGLDTGSLVAESMGCVQMPGPVHALEGAGNGDMTEWALMVDNREIECWRGLNRETREACENSAIEQGLAARLERGVAFAPGVEIVCLVCEPV